MADGRTRVVVIGGGNAGLCAACAAAEQGAEVTLLERAPSELRGGDTRYSAGGMRFAYSGADDIRRLVPDLDDDLIARSDFGSYDEATFAADLRRVTQGCTDPALSAALVTQSGPTMGWLRQLGVRFAPIYGRQAFEVDGRFRFWGGLTLEVAGAGPQLVSSLGSAAQRLGVQVRFGGRAIALRLTGGKVTGVVYRNRGSETTVPCDSVVLAAGGFQANAEWRSRYLGPGWDLAKVRGCFYNTGDGIAMGLEVGASAAGHWSGCSAVQWDVDAPEFGDPVIGDGFQKRAYPFGILINTVGERFVDEGADFRNFTYAAYGRRVLEQPDQVAWQLFDAKVDHLLGVEYSTPGAAEVTAGSLPELADTLPGVDTVRLLATISEFNESVANTVAFEPNVKDGRTARTGAVPKSNWANTLDTPPFRAFAVTCGITFTFGGLRVDDQARVVSSDMEPISGLFAAGAVTGGLFYFNYPGGCGLTSGAVFGRLAGRNAAARLRA